MYYCCCFALFFGATVNVFQEESVISCFVCRYNAIQEFLAGCFPKMFRYFKKYGSGYAHTVYTALLWSHGEKIKIIYAQRIINGGQSLGILIN